MIDALIHASTLGTNTFFGQEGLEIPEIALITNRGFEDVIEIGRQNRPSLYDPFFTRPPPLVPRSRRYGVRGRILASGEELEPLDTEGVRGVARKACEEGVKVFVVSFLHSYRNPSHELLAAETIREACPGALVVASVEVDPQPLEYERTSTAVVNAALKPLFAAYLQSLREELERRGFRGRIIVMQSNGGTASLEEALRKPAAFIESGPSAGVIATAYLSRLMGVEKALSFDMGGTTAKASSIVGGEPVMVDVYEVGGNVHHGRIVRGSGYPVRLPHIDLAEVSAGGGTIAWVDPGGGLRLGPRSAGSDPGPACYGRGGREPTVTDANLILGRLPVRLAGGLRLDMGLAERAVREKIADPLGMDLVEAAWAIVRLANTIMGRAVQLVTVERGLDPGEFTLYAFGGAGPLHAVELASEVGVAEVVVPPLPGVYSALGLLVSDYRHDLHAPLAERASALEDSRLERVFMKLEEEALDVLLSEGVNPERILFKRAVEARYWGQAYTLQVPYRGSVDATVEEFHRAHEARYGFRVAEEEVEFVLARVEAVGVTEKPRITGMCLVETASDSTVRPVDYREAFFGGEEWIKTPIYRRSSLPTGSSIEGPAIVEEPGSTTVVPPGYCVYVHETCSLLVRRC